MNRRKKKHSTVHHKSTNIQASSNTSAKLAAQHTFVARVVGARRGGCTIRQSELVVGGPYGLDGIDGDKRASDRTILVRVGVNAGVSREAREATVSVAPVVAWSYNKEAVG